MRRVLLCCLFGLTPALAGCSSDARLTGKVSCKGRLVTSGSVIVLNADGSARSGVIHPDGTYLVEGVKRGTVRLGVFSPDPIHARSILKPEDHRSKTAPKSGKNTKPAPKVTDPGWFPLPHDVGDPQKSGLTCDVNRSHVEHNIEIIF
jgi:hypothetical protein